MTVHCLLYTSNSQGILKTSDLKNILDSSLKFNAENDVTGILLYRNQSFMQLLEGSKDTVTNLYTRICDDDRHSNCQTVMTIDVNERNLETWSMGFLHIVENSINTHYVDFVMNLAKKSFKGDAVLLHEHLLAFASDDL